jgi:hypothetical protein
MCEEGNLEAMLAKLVDSRKNATKYFLSRTNDRIDAGPDH